jgi:hypothetical protein
LQKWRVKCFSESFVLVESSVIFSNIGAENPPLLQAAKRQAVKKLTFFLFNFYFHYAAR